MCTVQNSNTRDILYKNTSLKLSVRILPLHILLLFFKYHLLQRTVEPPLASFSSTSFFIEQSHHFPIHLSLSILSSMKSGPPIHISFPAPSPLVEECTIKIPKMKFPDIMQKIVCAQFLLTAWFRSSCCRSYHKLVGLCRHDRSIDCDPPSCSNHAIFPFVEERSSQSANEHNSFISLQTQSPFWRVHPSLLSRCHNNEPLFVFTTSG